MLGHKAPGFYKQDVLRAKKKRLGWTKRNSLGERHLDTEHISILAVMKDGTEIGIFLDGGELSLTSLDGQLVIIPFVSNRVGLKVRPFGDF